MHKLTPERVNAAWGKASAEVSANAKAKTPRDSAPTAIRTPYTPVGRHRTRGHRVEDGAGEGVRDLERKPTNT